MALDIDIAANLRPLLRSEYDELVETGALEGARVELLQGVLVEVTPQGVPHTAALVTLHRMFAPLLQRGYDLRVQFPLAAGPADEPEPDLAGVEARDPWEGHPSTAALVVEAAYSSQRMDLGYKARLYASAGVPDYWVVDLAARRVLVHREPGADGYAAVHVLVPGETVAPLVAPDLAVEVARVVGRA